jgi:two-component system CheB/CheR fusion protein
MNLIGRRHGNMHPPKDSPSLRVLVVEDELVTAESLALFLRSWGHEVSLASNGPDALGVVSTFQPEVVLLDIGLPNMDGYEFALRLRRLPGMERCLLMALTGQGCEADARRYKEAGLDFHFLKPVEPSLLREVLSSAGKFRREQGQLIS